MTKIEERKTKECDTDVPDVAFTNVGFKKDDFLEEEDTEEDEAR